MSKCPLSLVRPRPLFPLPADVLISALLRALHQLDVDEAVICANGKTSVLRKYFLDDPAEHVRLGFYDDELPRGTAGCLADVADFVRGGTFLVLEAGLYLDGDLGRLIEEHRRSGSALTLASVPARHWMSGDGDGAVDEPMSPLGVYVAEPAVLEHIPTKGYCDIKEQLIPRLCEKSLDVSVTRYCGRHRRVAEARSYVRLVYEILSGVFGRTAFAPLREVAPGVWASENAQVDPSATLIGPVVVAANAVVGAEAVIAGPALIGERVLVGDRAFVNSSIVWPNASIGFGARVEHSVVADSFRVAAHAELSRCVAVDHELKLGDVHGLRLGGYGLRSLGRSVGGAQGQLSVIPALRKLWRSVAAVRRGNGIVRNSQGSSLRVL